MDGFGRRTFAGKLRHLGATEFQYHVRRAVLQKVPAEAGLSENGKFIYVIEFCTAMRRFVQCTFFLGRTIKYVFCDHDAWSKQKN